MTTEKSCVKMLYIIHKCEEDIKGLQPYFQRVVGWCEAAESAGFCLVSEQDF